MHRWTSLLAALMLVLTLWTGGATPAAAAFNCIPVSVEALGHFEGDPDQSPSSPDQGVSHHHAGCTGHYEATPSQPERLDFALNGDVLLLPRSEAGTSGHGPEAHLRPPMA